MLAALATLAGVVIAVSILHLVATALRKGIVDGERARRLEEERDRIIKQSEIMSEARTDDETADRLDGGSF